MKLNLMKLNEIYIKIYIKITNLKITKLDPINNPVT